MKARCINAGPYNAYEVGKVYDYTVYCGVCDIKGSIAVSKKNFPIFFEDVKDE